MTRQLAGLAHNVVAHLDQDRHEANDFLLPAQIAGRGLHSVHRQTLVRIDSRESSVNRNRMVVGGCPNSLLATLCAAFNEHLMAHANSQVATRRPVAAGLRSTLSLDVGRNKLRARRANGWNRCSPPRSSR